MWITRRTMLATTAALAATPSFASPPPDFAPVLEQTFGGRLGVSVLDTANGHRYAHRGGERFLMCSVFKLLAVGCVLSRADRGQENLDREIAYAQSDLLPHSPVTTAHAGEGHLPLRTLCEAAIAPSDNTAGNLILAQIGGPAAVTAYARTIGDKVTRLDRNEMALNRSSGDLDTTSPDAMLADLHALALGQALKPASRAAIVSWLKASDTGNGRIKSGVPSNWIRGGKTGSGYDNNNDVVILWPSEGRPPVLVAAFYVNDKISGDARDNVLMEVGRAIAANFG